uniref:protein-serine/threonine phosphatase n=1 Tax=Aegilops tauschii subsp. strangulata TaxID=200361 RepID=A0A453SJR0_AEGTS
MSLPPSGHRTILLLILIELLSPLLCTGESATCLAVYREGGAPAVYQSAHCPRWTILSAGEGDGDKGPSSPQPRRCHVAAHRGRRRSQEDRAVCALGIRIPFIEQMRIKEVDVGVMAIFDGHNGDEASEMASKLLLEYLLLHVYFLLDGIYSIMFRNSTGKLTHKEVTILNSVLNLYKEDQSNHGQRSCWISPTILDRSFHMEILKESLLRAVQDIDLTFSKEALRKKFKSGSTATVVLIADGQIITANVGDSKAFLCSQSHASYRQKRKRRRKRNSSNHEDFALANYGGPLYNVKELTRDHHPDREDERRRVEAAGGYVLEWAGVYRVNGELALSRAIGDVPFKRYGVISTPELTGWQLLSANDSFLIASSDGVFEKMSMQDVCDMMLYAKYGVNQDFEPLAVVQQNLADFIVHLALQKGTTDNVAAVIVPLGSPSSSGARIEDWHHLEENSVTSVLPLQTIPYQHKSDDGVSSAVIEMEYFKRSSTKFQRFLVDAKLKRLGCFYLSESLDEDMDFIFRVPKDYQHEGVHDFNHMPTENVLSSDDFGYIGAQEILKNTRTETFAGTLSIKMMKWDDVLVLKGLQIILACLILFHIMEADQAVHMHLAIR